MNEPHSPPAAMSTSHQALWRAGRQHAMHGHWQPALECFSRIVVEDRDNTAAVVQIAYLLLMADRYQKAHEFVLRAANGRLSAPAVTIEIAKLLQRFDETRALSDLVTRSDFVTCRSPHLLAEMARLLSISGRHDEALVLLDAADKIDASKPMACYSRGLIQMFSGDMQAAKNSMNRTLALSPNMAHAHWVLSMLDKDAPEPPSVELLEAVLAQTAAGSEDEAYLAYALHNRLHTLGRYDEAWSALERGWRTKRKIVNYQKEQQVELFDALQKTCTREFVVPEAGPDDFCPIFIVGMYRSGTTLLERVFGGHSLVTDGGETYEFTAQMRYGTDHYCPEAMDPQIVACSPEVDFSAVGKGFLEHARWRARGRNYLTEKLPANFLNIGFILKALPGARILHMVRDPVDTCFSNLRTLYAQLVPYAFDQVDMAEYYLLYKKLMAHWHDVAPGKILDVHYDDFVRDPEAQTRRAMNFCGLDYQPSALDVGRASGIVATASTADVRSGIRRDRGDAWKPYEKHLGPLFAALASPGA